MTLPRWVDPDPPDGDGGTGDAGPASADDSQEDLSQKPVLEWTNEDWARWVDSPDLALPDRGAGPDAEADAEGEAEAEVEVEVEVETGGRAGEGEGDVAAAALVEPEAEPDTAGPPEWVRLLEEVAPVGAAGVTPTVAAEPVADAEAEVEPEPEVVAEPVADAEPPPAAGVIEVEPTVEEESAPTGEWFFGTTERPDELDEGPAIVTGTFPAARSPVGPGEPEAPWTEEEWAEVAEHPWWQSAPEPDPASARLVAVEPEPEIEVGGASEAGEQPEPEPEREPEPAAEEEPVPLWASEALVPALPLSPPAPRPAPAPPPPRFAPAAPTRPAARRGPAVFVDETSHRIRAAFSLLGVAVLVGTVMAGLITIVVFAIALALRQAVG